jgi:hypothetical protein
MQVFVRKRFALTAVGALLVIGSARAEVTCHKIGAKGEGQITSQTPTETDTESQIIGGGIIHGTTTAQLFPSGFDPTTGIETFEGTLILTTEHGTLTLSIFDGVFNTLTGEFSDDSVVVAGTDRFDGATSGLFFHGFVAADGTFTDDEISGQICANLPKERGPGAIIKREIG